MGKIKVLVVEDSKCDQECFAKNFGKYSEYELEFCETLREADLKHAEYDVVVCDLNLPDGGYIETTQWISSVINTVVCVAYTGFLNAQISRRLGSLGIVVFDKNLGKEGMINAVAWAVGARERRESLRKEINTFKRILSGS